MSEGYTPQDRARDRRESLMWMILATAGTVIPLGFVFVSRTHFPPGTPSYNPVEFVFISGVLIALIPFAVKANHQLGLPGGPLITAALNHEPKPFGWGEVVLGGVLWSVTALVVWMIAIAAGVGLLLYFFPSFLPILKSHYPHSGPTVRPSAIWLVSDLVTSALSAGVQEEILFRFVLMGVFSWALSAVSGDSDQPTSRQLWIANIAQAYFFGLAHLRFDFHLAKGVVGLGKVLIHPLILPQTVSGIFFGWLYLRKGLETSMVSHMFFDLLQLIGLSPQ